MLNFKKRFARTLIVGALCYVCYLFGLFTHLLEEDISNFKHAHSIDIRLAIQENHDKNNHIGINKVNYEFLLKSESTCGTPAPYLVILVKSKLTNFEQRRVIRETWGAEAQKSLVFPTRLVFLIGVPEFFDNDDMTDNDYIGVGVRRQRKLSDLNSSIHAEYEMFGDIVQQNFHDTYFNNTLKAVMGLKWIDIYCQDSKYYLFIDDDYYLNPNLLTKYLSEQINDEQYKNLYAGFVFENSSPMRHLLSKWYISLDEYPYDRFPPYVSAGCYIMSRKSARLFYIASQLIKLFRFDDIYLGILAYRLHIKPLNIDSIYFYEPYYEKTFFSNEVIASHGFSPKKLATTWKQLKF